MERVTVDQLKVGECYQTKTGTLFKFCFLDEFGDPYFRYMNGHLKASPSYMHTGYYGFTKMAQFIKVDK